jgi:hypothetical protein
MLSYSNARSTTDLTLTALQKELDTSFTRTRKRAEALSDRQQELEKRQKVFTEQNGGYLVSDDDHIKINVGGSTLSVRREILTLIKGSRLEILFSGRWENRLLRDDAGNVFMDVDHAAFKKIIEYLYRIKLTSLSNNASKAEVSTEELATMGQYIDYFGLSDELYCGKSTSSTNSANNTLAENKNSFYDKLHNCIQNEEEELVKLEKNLDKYEKFMGEESYVSFFITRIGNAKEEDEEVAEEEDDFTMINSSREKNNDTTMEDNNTTVLSNEKANTVLNLYLNGEIMAVRRSTLCHYKQSILANQFSDDKWIESQTTTLDNGKQAVLIEQPPSAFKMMIKQLRLRAMLKLSLDYGCKKNPEEAPMMEQLVSYYFPGSGEIIFGNHLTFESNILSSKDAAQLTTWLEEVKKSSEPQLLYRGSRDGWKHQNFHYKCNSKGATITIAKTKEGYVFGGFSDKSFRSVSQYESSDQAFLFSIKCNADLPPFTMQLRPNKHHYALLQGSQYGPSFGEQIDLCIGNPVSMKKGNYSFGSGTYHLPDFAEKDYLTGDIHSGLEFEEVEVFAV